MSDPLSLRKIIFALTITALSCGEASAFEPPVFALNDAQLKALEEYSTAKTEKAFAAGSGGQFSAQTGFASLTIAAREALKACDEGVSDETKRCILIDVNGERLSNALQVAQLLRVDPGLFEKPLRVPDLVLDVDAWRAKEGYREKGEHKAFALSLKGPWARSWEGATLGKPKKRHSRAATAMKPRKKRRASSSCATEQRFRSRSCKPIPISLWVHKSLNEPQSRM
jgi:hypothetical protein